MKSRPRCRSSCARPAAPLRHSRSARRGRSGRLRWPDALTLFAVGTVVLLVSLPRLRGFALRENQGDASLLVQRLGSLLDDSLQAAELPTVREVVQQDSRFSKQLGDAEFLDDGRLLRRHGYLFEVVPASALPPAPNELTEWRVRAWPWEHGRSGLASFVWLPGRGLALHTNADGRWSGPAQGPAPVFDGALSDDAGEWRWVRD